MTDPTPKAPLIRKMLDELSTATMKRSASESIKKDICVQCAKPVKVEDFRDAISLREYAITGLCQTCQDIIYDGMEE